MNRICIVAAKRTPLGKFRGSLASCSAVDLAVAAGEAALSGLRREWVNSVIIGCVLTAGQGMNIARQVGVRLGLPIETPASTVNMMCASGMHAILLAVQSIRAGDASCVLCGGTESMSNAPYLLDRAKRGAKIGGVELTDSLLSDGLMDSFGHGHMGLTADQLANEYSISREAQDAFAATSQARCAAARAGAAFNDELMPVNGLDHDEHARPQTNVEKLAELMPSFRVDGTVTAGNSSGLNDGAAMLVVCDEHFASQHDLRALAFVSGGCSVGCEPALMGLGPVHATRNLCSRMRRSVDSFDLVELNEAFAAQALACMKDLRLDNARVNVNGGAIALGHPIGASGARIVGHLAHRIARGVAKTGLATLCVGGGMGSALALEGVY